MSVTDKTITSAIKEKEGSGQSGFTEIKQRLRLFNTLLDSRFEDLKRETRVRTTYRDMSAGLIVALTRLANTQGTPFNPNKKFSRSQHNAILSTLRSWQFWKMRNKGLFL